MASKFKLYKCSKAQVQSFILVFKFPFLNSKPTNNAVINVHSPILRFFARLLIIRSNPLFSKKMERWGVVKDGYGQEQLRFSLQQISNCLIHFFHLLPFTILHHHFHRFTKNTSPLICTQRVFTVKFMVIFVVPSSSDVLTENGKKESRFRLASISLTSIKSRLLAINTQRNQSNKFASYLWECNKVGQKNHRRTKRSIISQAPRNLTNCLTKLRTDKLLFIINNKSIELVVLAFLTFATLFLYYSLLLQFCSIRQLIRY